MANVHQCSRRKNGDWGCSGTLWSKQYTFTIVGLPTQKSQLWRSLSTQQSRRSSLSSKNGQSTSAPNTDSTCHAVTAPPVCIASSRQCTTGWYDLQYISLCRDKSRAGSQHISRSLADQAWSVRANENRSLRVRNVYVWKSRCPFDHVYNPETNSATLWRRWR